MTYVPAQAVDATHAYTTALDSTFERATATLAELGRDGIMKDYTEQMLGDYFDKIPLIDFVRDNAWLAQHTTVEDGANAVTWGAGEFDFAKHGQIDDGWTTTNEPVRVNAAIVLSVNEVARNNSLTDDKFKIFIAEKMKKPLRDYKNKIISRFLAEVLNKVDDGTSDYLAPDTEAILSNSHVNQNGENPYDNLIAVTGSTVLDEATLKAVGEYSATTTETSGVYLDSYFDTFIVRAASDNFYALMDLFQVNDALAMGRAQTVAFKENVTTYPQSGSQIQTFAGGGATIVSVKGMDEKLWLALDSSQEAPVKFRVVRDLEFTHAVPGGNSSMAWLYDAFVDFWVKLNPRYVVGGRFA